MAQPKLTDEQIEEKARYMLEQANIDLPCEVNSEFLFKKLKRVGFSRHTIVKYILKTNESTGRRIDLKGNRTISIDTELAVSINKATKVSK